MFFKKKVLCFLLSCDLLVSRLNATSLTIADTLDFEIGNHKHDKQALRKGSFGPQKLEKGALIYLGKKLTTGGYGTIYEGFIGYRNVIIKQIRPEKGAKGRLGIQEELNNSRALTDVIAEKLTQNPTQYNELLEMDPIIPAIAQTTNGSLVQKRIRGWNLHEIVSLKQTPYRFGFPDYLSGAIERAANFFRGLALLHHFGFVHCDIKPRNIMIDYEYCLCHIIDLGAMKRFGKKIQIHSNNGAPEFIEQTCAIKDYEVKRKELLTERAQIANKIEMASDSETIKQLKERNGIIETQLSEIATAIAAAKKMRDPIARPAYDIYSSVPILWIILFGKAGRQLANDLYFRQAKDPIQFQYLHIARQPGFNAEEYFTNHCSELNQAMREKTGKAYPELVIKQLARLLARMSSLNLDERPSAIEILETLEFMGIFLESEL